MKRLLFAGVIALIPFQAVAQTPDSMSAQGSPPVGSVGFDRGLATRAGHEINISVSRYAYIEPGRLRISIRTTRVAGEYTGTLLLGKRQQWFVRASAWGTIGNTTYRGWCLPWLIRPNNRSPNGYELDLGDASPCSESGDADWYIDGRALIGKDFISDRWRLSPYTGLGVRHLSNGTTGAPGYRTDTYLYPPLGIAAHTNVASHRVLLTLEYDRLIRGWQKTRNSKLGGGDVPATPTAPSFTINGITDIEFAQHSGWALRTGAKYHLTNRWSVEPYFVHWSVGASPVNYQIATFTVNNVIARQQLGAYEPFNVTNEFGVKLGFHF